MDKLKNKNLGYSASEMACLVRHFSLIIGDLVPIANKVWDLYLILCQIVNIVSMSDMQKDCVNLLKTLIEEHN